MFNFKNDLVDFVRMVIAVIIIIITGCATGAAVYAVLNLVIGVGFHTSLYISCAVGSVAAAKTFKLSLDRIRDVSEGFARIARLILGPIILGLLSAGIAYFAVGFPLCLFLPVETVWVVMGIVCWSTAAVVAAETLTQMIKDDYR